MVSTSEKNIDSFRAKRASKLMAERILILNTLLKSGQPICGEALDASCLCLVGAGEIIERWPFLLKRMAALTKLIEEMAEIIVAQTEVVDVPVEERDKTLFLGPKRDRSHYLVARGVKARDMAAGAKICYLKNKWGEKDWLAAEEFAANENVKIYGIVAGAMVWREGVNGRLPVLTGEERACIWNEWLINRYAVRDTIVWGR